MATSSNEQDICMQHVLAASAAEDQAIALDRAGDVPAAIKLYEQCERELAAAIDAALPTHAGDQPKLVQHKQEISDRLAHLRSLKGKPSSIPVEQQIRAVELGMQATSAASSAASAAGGVKTLAACAALGAAGGFIVLGGVVGTSISLVGGAAGAAYVATRNDKLGDAARSAGGVAIAGAEKAKQLNEEHKVTEKIAEAGSKAFTAAKTFDEKHKITDKVSQGVGKVFAKAQEIESTHHVSDKVASGFSKGLGKLTSALDGVAKRGSGSGPASSSGQ
mmetsp:Transcript_55071/g.160724  ORF Transcript_55071/g.160724 Transcript_55071/m.160724 type:complete len:277 (-) Transcript_55071:67-897(-)